MHSSLTPAADLLAQLNLPPWLGTTSYVIQVIIGFSIIIFVHELGHFLAAKWVGIRVDRFAVGFGYRLFGWRRGEGFTFGKRPAYTGDELRERRFGETDYCFNALPFGGYVKMLGQDDVIVNEETGEMRMSDDPRAFTNKPVGSRMLVVSAGVIFNLLFAVLGYAAVFMLGRQTDVMIVGPVDQGSSAGAVGLRPGDEIVEMNGREIRSQNQFLQEIILAEQDLRMRVRRDGEILPQTLDVRLDQSASHPVLGTGFTIIGTNELRVDVPGSDDQPILKKGDRIVRVGDQPISNGLEAILAFYREAATGVSPFVEVLAERTNTETKETTAFTARVPIALRFNPVIARPPDAPLTDTGHILGLRQRQTIERVIPGQPADQGGLKAGDVIVQWDDVLNPLFSDITDSVKRHPGQALPVKVERDGALVDLTIVPQRPFALFRTKDARVEAHFAPETQRAVVADVEPDTPAADLNIPRGAEIVAVDHQPVENWFQVVLALRKAAGRDTTVRFRTAAGESEGTLAVPSSIVNELNLPLNALILEINSQRSVRLPNQKTARLPSALAIRAMLQEHAGQQVEVRYRPDAGGSEAQVARFAVAADASNVDPWQLRIEYEPPPEFLQFSLLKRPVQTSNPLKALALGTKATWDVLIDVYRTVAVMAKNLLERRAGAVQYVSGPVRIVTYAVERAQVGLEELLAFLAFISVNLAVINFIPFPVVDGGLMVFLIVEKIKGKPLGLRTQMVATLVGLATIVLVFLLVTIKDITRLWNG